MGKVGGWQDLGLWGKAEAEADGETEIIPRKNVLPWNQTWENPSEKGLAFVSIPASQKRNRQGTSLPAALPWLVLHLPVPLLYLQPSELLSL